MKATIDRFGRVVVPKAFRESLGLRPGAEITIEKKDREIVIRETLQTSPLQDEDGVLVFTGSSTVDISSAIQRQREKRLHKLSTETVR